jgi:hypothetical protein
MGLKSTITTPAVIEGVTQVNSNGDTIIATPVILINENGEFASLSGGGADLTETNNRLGATNSVVASTDSGNFNINSLIKKINQSFTTLLNRIPTLSNGKIPVEVESLPASLGAKTASNSFSITPASDAVFTTTSANASYTNYYITSSLSGDTTAIAAQGAGNFIYISEIFLQNTSVNTNIFLVKQGATTIMQVLCQSQGNGLERVYPVEKELKLPANTAFIINSSGANSYVFSGRYRVGTS